MSATPEPANRDAVRALAGAIPIPVAVACAGGLVIGLLGADRVVRDVFELEAPAGIATVTTGAMLGMSVPLAWALPPRQPGASSGRRALMAGIGLVAVACLAGVIPRALDALGASEALVRLAVAAGLCAAAATLLLMLARLSSAHRHARGNATLAATALISRVDAPRAGLILGTATLAISSFGSLVLIAELPVESFVINAEGTYPQYFNSGLLLAGSSFSLLAWRTQAHVGRVDPRWWLLFGLFLAYLAFDEITGFHERVQSKAAVDPLVVLAPIALAGAVLYLATLRAAMGDVQTQALYLLGAVSFALSQAVDVVGDSRAASSAEEVLETLGSALLAAALFLLARQSRDGTRLQSRDR